MQKKEQCLKCEWMKTGECLGLRVESIFNGCIHFQRAVDSASCIRALPVYVYKNPLFAGCSNDGISSMFDELLLICDDGNERIDPDNLPENLCKVVTRTIAGREYKHIEPFVQHDEGCTGWMSGGSLAYSSDARFHDISDYPLSIHDRQETWAQYEALSS